MLILNFFLQFVAILAPVSTCGRGRFFEMWLFQKVALKLCDWLHSETIKSGKLKKRADWWWGGRMLASLPFLHLFGRQRSSYLSIWQPRTNVFFLNNAKMFTLLNSSVGILDEVLEKGTAGTVNYSSSVMFHICQVSRKTWNSVWSLEVLPGKEWARIPVPSHYQEWKSLIPVPEIREWIF